MHRIQRGFTEIIFDKRMYKKMFTLQNAQRNLLVSYISWKHDRNRSSQSNIRYMYVSRQVQRNSNPQPLSSETKNQPYCKTGIIFKSD